MNLQISTTFLHIHVHVHPVIFFLIFPSTIVASRDFTYVEDLVEGVISAMDYKPNSCDEVYNLGRGRPISVSLLVSLLEEYLGKKAKIVG